MRQERDRGAARSNRARPRATAPRHLGMIDFGRAYYTQLSLDHIAREACHRSVRGSAHERLGLGGQAAYTCRAFRWKCGHDHVRRRLREGRRDRRFSRSSRRGRRSFPASSSGMTLRGDG